MFGAPGGASRMFGQETLKPKNLGETLARFGQYFESYWPLLIVVSVFVIGSTWTQVTTPEMIGQAVDCYLIPAAGLASGGGFSFQPGATAGASAIADNCWLASDSADTIWMHSQLRNAIYIGASAPTRADLGRVILFMVALFVSGAVLTGLSFFTMSWAGQGVLRNMRVDVFRHLHRLSQSYYADHEAGDLMSRIVHDATAIEQAFGFA